MTKKPIKKPLVLGILFFLPVIFLLFLYPSTHNYNTLDIVNENVLELSSVSTDRGEEVKLEGNITVLNFVGSKPLDKATTTLNLKELIYDKFLGFKRFQVVTIATEGSEVELEELRKQLIDYDGLKYWKFTTVKPNQVKAIFNSLLSRAPLDDALATSEVFIIDKDLMQRARLDDRTDNELAKNSEIYGLSSYNCVEVAELKNKMSEDLRILFTEYRQKRKGTFNSSTRRAEDIKTDEQN